MITGWTFCLFLVLILSSVKTQNSWNSEHRITGNNRVEFQIKEELPAGTFVGKIPIRSGFTYRFSATSKDFSINSTSGEIFTVVPLDREALTSNKIDMLVLSSEPTYPIELRIYILDTNDHAPSFPSPISFINFLETDSPGQQVLIDTAADPDIDINGITTNYKIISGSGKDIFRLIVTTSPSGEDIFLHLENTVPLDRETQSSYELNISAQDGGNPPLYGYLFVNISISDLNDNPPIFDHSDYTVTMNESTPINSNILQVHATDADTGANAEITYFINDSESPFVIDSKTGEIRFIKPLNCQRPTCVPPKVCAKTCVVTIEARDHGIPYLSGRCFVTVNIIDQNDHDPNITFTFPLSATYATVDENAQNGTLVAVVSTVDPDDGPDSQTIVQIQGGNELGHFRLEPAYGVHVVKVNRSLDREHKHMYNLTIIAMDKGLPPRFSRAFLAIYVNDVNDHNPVFNQSGYNAVVSEFLPIGSFVTSVMATDGDSGINANIFYGIVAGNGNSIFSIDSVTGLVITNKYLTRLDNHHFVLNISARDGGPSPRFNYTTLTIDITDENDQSPVFNVSILNVTISEDAPINSEVVTVRAYDGDKGPNGTVSYFFHSDVEYRFPRVFSLDRTNGRILTLTTLDREITPFYSLLIIAYDHGFPPLSSTLTLNIFVTDVNDNSPIFYPNIYLATILENASVGTSVIQVKATDKDEGMNAIVRFAIAEGGDNFRIDEDSGIVHVAKTLNHDNSFYRLKIEASDTGKLFADPKATVDISVNVIPQRIMFQQDHYIFEIVEDAKGIEPKIGQEVGVVKASNPNIPELFYSIIDGDADERFAINSASGSITTKKEIDREKQSNYQLHVLAYGKQHRGETDVSVTIKDLNDNIPAFLSQSLQGYIMDYWPVGYGVLLAAAIDDDEGMNGQIIYSLSENSDLFYIGNTTGMIFLKQPAFFAQTNRYFLQVTARDLGSPSLKSHSNVTLLINNSNIHKPYFNLSLYEMSISESTPVNTKIFLLQAKHTDSGNNGHLVYNITAGNEALKFGIFPEGYVYLKSIVDYEKQKYFFLTVVVLDNGNPSYSSSANLLINIIDENDNAPTFLNKTFTFTIQENMPAFTSIGKVIARDIDSGRNGEVSYMIITNQNDFAINSYTGVLKTLKSFDREYLMEMSEESSFVIEVDVFDNGIKRLKDSAKVVIRISDENDNPPFFSKSFYDLSLSEKTPTGTLLLKVSLIDPDKDMNSQTNFSITEGNNNGDFSFDKGKLFLVKPLDRENISKYVLRIVAYNSANISLLSLATINIVVLDENDNTPYFVNANHSITVLETVPVNSELYQFIAEDKDIGNNRIVSFSIGSMFDVFKIGSQSGKLFLVKALDYEKQKTYTLNIIATDSGSPKLSSLFSFVINVADANDNAPEFAKSLNNCYVRENSPINTPICNVTASDADSGVNSEILYSLIKEEPQSIFFNINPKMGIVSTNAEIDREIFNSFTITVMATDQAKDISSRRSSEKVLTVIVEDVNDNAPKFNCLNAATVPINASNGFKIMTVLAIDADAGANGLVTYSITDGDKKTFFLDRNTGDLYLSKSLTRSQTEFLLIIQAADEADQLLQKTSTKQVTILVISNESAGILFSHSNYSATVVENKTIGTPVLTLEGSIAGQGTNNIKYYITTITSDNKKLSELFHINSSSGVITTADILDREQLTHQIIIEVYARLDISEQAKANSVQVYITVMDENDTPPKFTNGTYIFSVPENAPIGYVITTFSAIDPDLSGTLTYSLLNVTNNLFDVDSHSGKLVVNGKLDRESKATHFFLARVSDGVQAADVLVRVLLSDINDNAPMFSEDVYSFVISENADVGSEVGMVVASDADDGYNAKVSYALITEWGADVFHFDGIFILSAALDYEMTQLYVFEVAAIDGGNPSLSSTITVYINVVDVNDNAPVFNVISYRKEVYENISIGTYLLTVNAMDNDSGPNGKINYSIISGDVGNQFNIDANGSVYTMKALDREDQSFYILTVMAVDQCEDEDLRLSSSIQVKIFLKDINDSPPKFTSPNEITVLENTPINSVITAVKAVDLDEGQSGYIEYVLLENKENRFKLGLTDGLLRVNGLLDAEEQNQYKLVVSATDQGVPALSSTMTLMITVLDENDNSPVFVSKQYKALLRENVRIGTSVLTVTATDQDSGLNGYVQYFIVRGDDNHDFEIEESTGLILVYKNLDYERTANYLLSVMAQDGTAGSHFDITTVDIGITDVNDNPPVFHDSPYNVYIMENYNNLPAIVMKITAFDADSPPNAGIMYSIKDGDLDIFSIDSTNGILKVMQPLDREKKEDYALIVSGLDSGFPKLTGTGTIFVKVMDENDHSPVFLKSSYTGYIPENSPPYTSVTQVSATDEDVGVNAVIRYRLLTYIDKFIIDESTGNIFSVMPLDREEQDSYFLRVIAMDSSPINVLSSAVNVTITVTDVNDNTPKFSQSSYRITLPDPIALDESAFRVEATDLDDGLNARIIYHLFGSGSELFYINNLTGIIKAKYSLSEKKNLTVAFTIQATDSGKPSLSSNATYEATFQAKSLFPTFTQRNQSFSVLENAVNKTITSVTALSSIKGTSNAMLYQIVGGNIRNVFNVNSQTGAIVVAKPLDFESIPEYNLWISAHDAFNATLAGFIELNISIIDVNDNPPEFESVNYQIEILEEQIFAQYIMTVKATDKDSGPNSEITYGLTSSDTSQIFSINPSTGQIKLNTALDREKKVTYSLLLTAVDHGIPPLTGTASLLVLVSDKNDYPPKFTRQFNVNVNENVPIGKFVIQLTSTDEDIGRNAVAIYSFERNIGGKFKVDPSSGRVTVSGSLDREDKDVYSFNVVVKDGSWQAKTLLTITILDQNDNAPVFGQPYYIFQTPPLIHFSSIGRVTATDVDKSYLNSNISFWPRVRSFYFKIDPITGEIYNKHNITYDKMPPGQNSENIFAFDIVAMDSGYPLMSSETTVVIQMVENSSKALLFEYFSPVPENASIKTPVIQIKEILWSYSQTPLSIYTKGNASTLFVFDNKTGWITVSHSLIGLVNKSFVLYLQITDYSYYSFVGSVSLLITDDNRFAPVFDKTYEVSIPENSPVNKSIAIIKASDKDHGINGLITYYLDEDSSSAFFSIDSNEGTIFVIKELDFEKEKVHIVNVTATDGGFYKKETNARISIILTDVNDNPPLFEKKVYNVYVRENSPPGSKILQLIATDKDSEENAIILYSFEDHTENLFLIDKENGTIFSNVNLDYEKQNYYSLIVTAYNPDKQMSSSAIVNIHIMGVNEVFPRFKQKYYNFNVSRTANLKQLVGMVTAVDEDAGFDGAIYYIFIGESNSKGFSINLKSGMITLAEKLTHTTRNSIVLTVLAKNYNHVNGHNDTDTAQVIITIVSGSEPPVFDKVLYEEWIPEGSDIGTSVCKVSSNLEHEVELTYVILEGNVNNAFIINAKNGHIQTNSQLYKDSVSIYNLTIGALDNASPPQTGMATVKVYIVDDERNLHFESSVGYIHENQPGQTNIMILKAKGSGTPPFTYNIVGGDFVNYFQLNKKTGSLETTRIIDRESTPSFQLQVEISDSSSQPKRSVQPLYIEVLDENDNPSYPRLMKIFVQTVSSAFPGGMIANVNPLDVDTSDFSQCKIQGSNFGIFTIMDGCHLYSSATPSDISYNLDINSNDNVFPVVNYRLEIDYQAFDNNTLDNTVSLLLTNQSATEFLNISYLPLLQVLTSLFHQKEKIMLYAIDNSSYSNLILFLATRKEDSSYLSKAELTRILSNSLSFISQKSGISIDVINFDPCNLYPCIPGARCNSKIGIINSSYFLWESQNVVFTSPKVQQKYSCWCNDFSGKQCDIKEKCTKNLCKNGGTCEIHNRDSVCNCRFGYTGNYCEIDHNECRLNPCKNGGECYNIPESYKCKCKMGFGGINCEISFDNPCYSNPCHNEGNCIVTGPNKYLCECKKGFFGSQCESSSKSFELLSYMEFHSLNNNTIGVTVEFRTVLENALLLYNHGSTKGTTGSDYLALEIINKNVHFSYRTKNSFITKVYVNKDVTTGHWFKATASRNTLVDSLTVTSCPNNQLTCDVCTNNDISCSSQSFRKQTSFLNFDNIPLLLGGIKDISVVLQRPGQINSYYFNGCIRKVRINDEDLNMNNPLSSNLVKEGCIRNENLCSKDRCGRSGICLDKWSHHSCTCTEGFVAPNCDKALEPFSFGGNSRVEYTVKEEYRRQLLMSSISANRIKRDIGEQAFLIFSLKLRTKEMNGLLLYAEETSASSILHIVDGGVEFIYKNGTNDISLKSTNIILSDSNWYNVSLLQYRSQLHLLVNGKTIGSQQLVYNLITADTKKLFIGGTSETKIVNNKSLKSFDGCISTLIVNNEVQPMQGSSELFNVLPYGDIGKGCSGITISTSGNEPLSIGIIVVIVFFGIVIIVILVSFLIFRRRRMKKAISTTKRNCSTIFTSASNDSGRSNQDSGFLDNNDVNDESNAAILRGYGSKVYKDNDIIERGKRPDIIGQEFLGNATPTSLDDGTIIIESGDLNHLEPLQDTIPEHYDLENASSIAPSDIDVAFHYQNYRDGPIRKYKTNPHIPNYHKHNHRPAPNPLLYNGLRDNFVNASRQSPNSFHTRMSPNIFHSRNIPLMHLSSSQLSHQSTLPVSRQSPRILTLQDISGKPLPSSFQDIKDSHSNSPNSRPQSETSMSTASIHSQKNGRRSGSHLNRLSLSSEDLDKIDIHPQVSNLVRTLDALSSTSDEAPPPKAKRAKANREPTSAALLEPPDSSSDESGNDSFTCSEFEYDQDARISRDFDSKRSHFSKVPEVDNENGEDSNCFYEGFDSICGSLSTLMTSDDDFQASPNRIPAGAFDWDYLLNWGPNFEKLVDVFKDIAELPETSSDKNEEYV